MKQPKILLIEDTSEIEVDLKNRLLELNFKLEAIISSPSMAKNILEKNNIDLVLTDLFLKEDYTGINASADISRDFNIPVILLCGEDNLKYSELKKSSAQALLTKPLKNIELEFNINAILYEGSKSNIFSEKNTDYIFVRADYRLNKIRVKDIYYLEATKDYVTIHTSDNIYKVHATMKDMETILPTNIFLRTHRSFIVNIDKIFSIKYPDILIENKMKNIPIGGFYRKNILNKINVI